ncbi:glycosyl hydrolase family 95 catalytic domain-containing protein [Pinibacter aurantiacus]|uniref:Glycoside hydrolase N-terminal domain-containing protein n=1 Tax=Pinibacter aurantiacus TaxID=2851599 RepID=A0A9E2SG04_9BACT|nr:glycoside hydrolase N-terminal domain-containing protein [Pinibacter aurantiacus]MBV4360620.1 glycoside hydrolase N-terminal domain-containing protein [Pinibacter aurantiacus]
MRVCFLLLLFIVIDKTQVVAQNSSGRSNPALQKNASFRTVKEGRWIAWSKKPAIAWQDAFVTGNGHHGMMPTGEPGKERLICVHEELFLRAWDRNKIAVANIANLLPQVRQLANEDHLGEAAKLACDEARSQLTAMGAPLAWSVLPHPAFDLNLQTQTEGTIKNYRRQLNMETGEATTYWQDNKGAVEQSVFSSRIHDVNVLRIRALAGQKLSVELSLDETPGRTGKILESNADSLFRTVKSYADEKGWLSYHAQYAKDSGGYEGLARVITNGTVAVSGNHLLVKGASEILVVLRVTPLQYGATSQRAFVQNELSLLPSSYETLFQPHAKAHAAMFNRVSLDLGAAAKWKSTPTEEMLAEADSKGITPLFLEQMHAMGRYLLISSSGKYPPPLQGIWGGSWNPAWIGGFVFDSNVNLAISAFSTGDLSECAESYFGYVERLLPAWRLNARNYLGCRGFLVPHYSDPEKGYLNHFDTDYPWMYWPSGAGWNLMPFYEHGMITGDTAFLHKRVLPLYIEMAQFYEDYLVKEKDGYYHIAPGISPENNVGENTTTLARDCTIDIAVAKEVFDHLITLAKMFHLDKEDIAKWQQYHDNIVPYGINADGALAEWVPPSYPDNYAHRHNSHLYAVFPGTEFLQPGADTKLLDASRVALEKRFQFNTESAHGLVHIALMAARLHDAEKVLANLNRFAKSKYVYTGLSTSHNPAHDIYNLDAALSLQRLLSESIVFSQPRRIEFLPACAANFPAGTITGVCIHGGHKLNVTWANGSLVSAVIKAGTNDICTVVYNNKQKTMKLVAGKQYVLNGEIKVIAEK